MRVAALAAATVLEAARRSNARLASKIRRTNTYGGTAGEREQVRADLAEIEPLLAHHTDLADLLLRAVDSWSLSIT
ncbi:MAG: hypothetical protein M3387_06585 [Actinomycetota bacterium]|nr:hypothetical protein [Actinomycetota bacterium]